MTRPLIDPDIAPYAQAVEFVFAREDECIRTDGACGDDEFYAAFDVLPRNVAVLVDGYLKANTALIAAGLSRPQREQAMQRYAAVDWRTSHAPRLAA